MKTKVFFKVLVVLLTISVIAGCSGKGSPADNIKGQESNVSQLEDQRSEVKTDSKESSKEEEQVPDYLNLTGFPIVKEPLTLKMMGRKQVTHTDWDKMIIWQEYEKMTGIHIEWNTPDQSGYQEKKNLAFASGELPDAFIKGFLTNSDLISYGSQGILISLNELIDKYAPNIKAVLDKYPEVRKSIVTPDGNIYSIPQVFILDTSKIGNEMYINKVWLDKLGLEEPTTTEEYYQVLKAFKTEDPNGNGQADEIPLLSESGASNIIVTMMGSFGLGNRGQRHFDVDPNGNLRFISADDRYKEMMIYLNKLYAEGLMDPQSFVQDRNAAIAKGAAGVVGSACYNSIDMIGIPPKDWDNYVVVAPLKGPMGDQLYSNIRPMVSNVGAFAITNLNKYPEATMRWVDYFYSEEGATMYFCGIEGLTFERKPDGKIMYTDLIANNPNGLNMNQATGQYTPLPGGCDPIIYLYDKEALVSEEKGIMSQANYEKLKPYLPEEAWPSFIFTNEEQNELTALQNDIYTYVDEMTAKFVMGDEPISSWDKYVDTLKQMGLDRLMEIFEAAYERWKNS